MGATFTRPVLVFETIQGNLVGRSYCLLALFFIPWCGAIAQNLVPNPGFDSLSACPYTLGQLPLAAPWKMLESPDLFNECATSSDLQVPNNFGCNYLQPHNGGGYVGLVSYFGKEMVYTSLLKPLEAGKQYYARFYVAPDDECPSSVHTFSDAIGMRVKGTGANDNFETVVENLGNVLRDTANWTRVGGCFQAKGGELTLQIGNFRSDDETLLESSDPTLPSYEQGSYLYIDDVLLAPYDPFPDTVLMCNGEPVALDASFYGASIAWDHGDTIPVFTAIDTGVYALTAKIDGCTLRDKVMVVNLDHGSLAFPDTFFCEDETLVLSPGIVGEYLWNNGAKSQTLKVETPGTYTATITNTCGEFPFSQTVVEEDCRCRVYVPNAFTPNGDGINDVLDAYLSCDYGYEIVTFAVFDRWGGKVWSSNTALNAWDGKLNGKDAPIDAYVWYLEYNLLHDGTKKRRLEKGDINLVR